MSQATEVWGVPARQRVLGRGTDGPARPGFKQVVPGHHLIASAETGPPEAPVTGRGDAENMNS